MTAAPSRSAAQRRWVASAAVPLGRRQPTHTPRHGVPALNGIRGIAVALVVVDHGGIPGRPGGFIGVDVFFVLSGFLITSLLLDELGRTGRLDLRGFWIRRARRLLPALLLMVLAVVFVRALFPPESVATLRDDAVAAFFWSRELGVRRTQGRLLHPGRHPRRRCSTPGRWGWRSSTTCSGRCCWPRWRCCSRRSHGAEAARSRRWPGAHGGVRPGRGGRAGVRGRGSPAVVGRLTEPRLLRHRYPRAGAAGRCGARPRCWCGTGRRSGRMVADPLAVGDAGSSACCRSSAWRCWRRSRTSRRAAPRSSDSGLLIVVALAAVAVIVVRSRSIRTARSRACWRCGRWCGWASSPTASTSGTGRSSWCSTENAPAGPATACSPPAALATLAAAGLSWWLIEQPIRRWRPAHVPLLRLAGATVATAAAVAMLVVPIGMRPGGPGPDVSAAATGFAGRDGPAGPATACRRPARARCRCSATRWRGR